MFVVPMHIPGVRAHASAYGWNIPYSCVNMEKVYHHRDVIATGQILFFVGQIDDDNRMVAGISRLW